jgi:hypothetical protein
MIGEEGKGVFGKNLASETTVDATNNIGNKENSWKVSFIKSDANQVIP